MSEVLDILATNNLTALLENIRRDPRHVAAFCNVAGFFSELVNNAYNAELGDDPQSVRAATAELMNSVRALKLGMQQYPPTSRELFPASVEEIVAAVEEMHTFAARPQHRGAVFIKGYDLLNLAYKLVHKTAADSDALYDIMSRLQQILSPISPAQEIPDNWD
jgi:hypothetical protein